MLLLLLLLLAVLFVFDYKIKFAGCYLSLTVLKRVFIIFSFIYSSDVEVKNLAYNLFIVRRS